MTSSRQRLNVFLQNGNSVGSEEFVGVNRSCAFPFYEETCPFPTHFERLSVRASAQGESFLSVPQHVLRSARAVDYGRLEPEIERVQIVKATASASSPLFAGPSLASDLEIESR